MTVLYIQLYQNRMVVRNLSTRQQASGDHTFSNQRIIIADFFAANDLMERLIHQVAPRRLWSYIPGIGRLKIVAHALEMNEGGLSAVEERAILESVFSASLGKCRDLRVTDGPVPLKDEEVLTVLNGGKEPAISSNKIIS